MTTISTSTQQYLRAQLQEQVEIAIQEFDASAVLEQMRDTLLNNASEIANSFLGIERRWGAVDLNDKGALKQHISPMIKSLLEQQLTPVVMSEVQRLLSTPRVQQLIMKSIKREVRTNIEDLGGYKSSLKDYVESLVMAEMKNITKEWYHSQETDEWLSNTSTSGKT